MRRVAEIGGVGMTPVVVAAALRIASSMGFGLQSNRALPVSFCFIRKHPHDGRDTSHRWCRLPGQPSL